MFTSQEAFLELMGRQHSKTDLKNNQTPFIFRRFVHHIVPFVLFLILQRKHAEFVAPHFYR